LILEKRERERAREREGGEREREWEDPKLNFICINGVKEKN
jgi:hypothetical protein